MKTSIMILTGALAIAAVTASCSSKAKTDTKVEENELNYGEIIQGDTLFKDKTMVISLAYVTRPDDAGVDVILMKTQRDNLLTDTTLIDGFYSNISVDKGNLVIVNGVDSALYPVASLPVKINPVGKMVIDDTELVSGTKSFAVGDMGSKSTFEASVYVRRHPKLDVTDFLTHQLQVSLTETMFDSSAIASVAPEMDVRQAIDFLGVQFEKAYRKEFSNVNEQLGYSFDAFYYPDWQSADKKLVTYMLYDEQYLGGAHGLMHGYYVTYDTEAHRPLGISDIFTVSGFDKVEKLLAEQVKKRSSGNVTTAYLDAAGMKTSIGYVEYNGRMYPRPALTPHGVTFVYQPYDIAPFSDGIIYILIPYSEISDALRPVK